MKLKIEEDALEKRHEEARDWCIKTINDHSQAIDIMKAQLKSKQAEIGKFIKFANDDPINCWRENRASMAGHYD